MFCVYGSLSAMYAMFLGSVVKLWSCEFVERHEVTMLYGVVFGHRIDPNFKEINWLSDNYSSWKRSLMIALNAKNKMKIITGEFVEPRMDSKLRALWERNNDMLISWILNTVSEQIGNNLNFINSASKLWLELQEHYAEIDGHRIYQLSNDIVQLKQENSFVRGLLSKVERINGERDQKKRLIQFLMGLDECYSNIRGQILLMQPLPNYCKSLHHG
ncbi:cysteine-rich receptor-like protein kinase 8 [Tanacetum coccineum]